MNTVFKIMIFSIVLNLSVGIMLNTIVDNEGRHVFNEADASGLKYDTSMATEFNDELNTTLTPSGTLEDEGNAIYRVLDTLNLGFIAKFISSVDTYMYGLVNMLRAIFGTKLGDSSNFIFGLFKIFMGIAYVIGAWYLWTGKSLND